MTENWMNVVQYSLQSVWVETVSVLPQIVVAVIILILGWLIGSTLKSLTKKVFASLKIDNALDAAGVDVITEKAGYKLDSGAFVGTLVKWFVIIAFFVAALDVLNLQQATEFLSTIVLGYLPQVIVAVLILFAGLILANLVEKVVQAGVKASSLGSPELFGRFSYYAIVLFTVLAVLNQLAIAPELVQMLFAGLVFALSLAFGLAFGLGGRDTAAHYLRHITGATQNDHHQHHG